MSTTLFCAARISAICPAHPLIGHSIIVAFFPAIYDPALLQATVTKFVTSNIKFACVGGPAILIRTIEAGTAWKATRGLVRCHHTCFRRVGLPSPFRCAIKNCTGWQATLVVSGSRGQGACLTVICIAGEVSTCNVTALLVILSNV